MDDDVQWVGPNDHEWVFQGRDRQWYFHVVGANGEKVAASEPYPTHGNAMRGIATLRRILCEADLERKE